MKKFLFLSCFFFLFSFSAGAQITKADFEQALTDAGFTIKDVKSLYVANYYIFYTDGSSTRTYGKYDSAKNKVFEMSVVSSGIKLIYSLDGTAKTALMIPFSKIARLSVSKDGLDIDLSN